MADTNLLISLAILVIAIIIVLSKSVKIIRQYEKGIVESLGRYKKLTGSGLIILIPFIESITPVDMREQVIKVEPQEVITKDNVSVTVDAVVYFKTVDPVKSTYEVANFEYACTTLAQTNLRNFIGDLSLDETLTARDTINTKLREVLDSATDSWGVKVTRVEVQKIDPPADITEAMSRQMKAERDKRAKILEAEGYKTSMIEQAEGDKQAAIKKAEGESTAKKTIAEAEAEVIKLVSEAAEKYFKDNAQTLKKLEVLSTTLAGNTKIIIPSNSDLVNVLGFEGGNVLPVDLKKKITK